MVVELWISVVFGHNGVLALFGGVLRLMQAGIFLVIAYVVEIVVHQHEDPLSYPPKCAVFQVSRGNLGFSGSCLNVFSMLSGS
jgi:hypothetical protein